MNTKSHSTIAHDVHPDVVAYFLNDYVRPEYPEHTNRAVLHNKALALGGCRCVHANGNHTVWENDETGERIVVSMCEIPTVTVTKM